jgi:hypothetical protein
MALPSLNELESWGLLPKKPKTTAAELPDDITDISSDELGELFTKLTAWTDYLASQVAEAILEERAAQKKKEFTETMALVKRMGSQAKGERVTAIKAEISVTPEVIELDNKYEEKYAYRKLVEMMLNNHERDLALVSREITRRSNARFSKGFDN